MLFLLAVTVVADPDLFSSWVSESGVKYRTQSEYQQRYRIWNENRREILAINSQNLPYKVKLNKFSDLTQQEYEANYLGRLITPTTPAITSEPQFEGTDPEELDWRQSGVMGPVKDQASCGSCWAFGALASVESFYSIATGAVTTYDFSEQQLVDCSRAYGNRGCSGGWPSWATNYIRDYGIMYTKDYKYTARDETCKADRSKFVVTCDGYTQLTAGNEVLMKTTLANRGPLSIAIYASRPGFRSYSSGVYYDTGCPRNSLNHAVTALGYGHDLESKLDYWIVRNSWGTSWGDKGHILMARNKGSNCGVADVVIYPNNVRAI
jgi:C1A family cysteine protease